MALIADPGGCRRYARCIDRYNGVIGVPAPVWRRCPYGVRAGRHLLTLYRGANVNGRGWQHDIAESEIDDTIASSFPASDPPGWSPSRIGVARESRRDLRDEDLEPLLVHFYSVATVDDLLYSYFAGIDMRRHMPRIVDFWSTMLFNTGRYSGSAFQPHARMPGLTAGHFERWVGILDGVVDARFEGPNARAMKALARRIAYSMQVRLGIAPRLQFTSG
jgi:hemoglobin